MSEFTDEARTALDILKGADVVAVSAAVLLRQIGEEVRLRRVQLADPAKARVIELVQSWRDDLVERALIDYEYGHNVEPQQALVVGTDEVAEAGVILDGLGNIENAPTLDLSHRESGAARLFLTDATFQTGNTQTRAVFVRGRVKTEVVRTSQQTALVQQNGVFDLLDSNQLVLHNRYEAVILTDYIFGTNTILFEQAFHFTDRIKADAAIAIQTHIKKLRIVNFDDLAVACQQNPLMARKAASIGRKMEVAKYADAMEMARVLDFVERRKDVVEIEIEEATDGTKSLVHNQDDPSARWHILKVFDDDYLTSELTDFTYDASSKSLP